MLRKAWVRARPIEANVLGLDIPMNHVKAVEVLHPKEALRKQDECRRLLQGTMRLEHVKEVTT